MGDDRRTVVVTGFGPFRSYAVNASWEAVKLLEMNRVNLIKREIVVAYDEVDNVVPELWSQCDPILVIHVGVSCIANCLVLESCASCTGYNGEDVKGCQGPGCGETAEDQRIFTQLDVANICDKVNQMYGQGSIKMPAIISKDAGRYLCEYIYSVSLKRDPKRTLFIHVPELDGNYSAEDISQAIKCVVNVTLDEINCHQ